MKKQIIFIVVGVFLSFLALEILLRLLGLGFSLWYRLPKEKKGTNYRIFCLGESTTFGVGASDPILKGYPHQLEEMLNSHYPHLKFQCFFDRTIGVNSSEMLIRLPAYFKKYHPDLIIIMAGINNWCNLNKSNILLFNKNRHISRYYLKFIVFLDRFRVPKLLKWITYSCGLIRYKSDIVFVDDPNINIEERTKMRMKGIKGLMDSIKKRYGLEIFTEIAYYDIREMIKICQDRKIKVIMCSYPRKGVGDLYNIHKKIVREFNVPFVDNYFLLKNLPDATEYFYIDNFHLNDRGYRLVAENIFNCIVDCKLIK